MNSAADDNHMDYNINPFSYPTPTLYSNAYSGKNDDRFRTKTGTQ